MVVGEIWRSPLSFKFIFHIAKELVMGQILNVKGFEIEPTLTSVLLGVFQ